MKREVLKKDQVLEGDSGAYRVVRRLGLTGATARVYQVKCQKDEQLFALKLMQPELSPEMQKHFRDEMANLQRLRAAEEKFRRNHIPRIIESSDLQQPKTQELLHLLGTPFIIMDFAHGTEVDTILMDKTLLDEAEALEITKQFAQVLEVIHGEGLTYTDMKLNNLFWDGKKEHLTVIDWNVVGEDEEKFEKNAQQDRLRAAAYLFRMVTGVPIELDLDGSGVRNQKFRRWEGFKTLSEGTRRFLIRAFHPEIASRHGEGGSQRHCTTEFLKELAAHAARFKMATKELIDEGTKALADRQWQEALEYLDLADRQFDIEADPGQFARLQEDLEKARKEAKKLGRNAFFSGHGSYSSGLFAEALADFERAMRDDPYDEEARLFAILTRFALDLEEKTFSTLKQPVEECGRALLKGHLDLAENALNRLPAETHTGEAFGSLKAEIKIRDAVKKGQQLLKEDKLEQARDFFRSAYQQRDRILYVEPLEENLGSLTQLYHNVEDLKKKYEEGDAYFEEERFHEAAWVFWKAREISQGSPLANRKYQIASRFDTITKLLEKGHLERAMEECNRTASRFGDEPKYKRLYNRIIDARCEQLRRLADNAFQANDFKSAKEYIQELIKWKPDDEAAKVKLEDILKEIAGGYKYKEKIEQLQTALKKDASEESCEQAVRFVIDQGWARFPDAAEFIKWAEELNKAIVLLSQELDDAAAAGDLQAQMQILNKAKANNWTLRQGKPGELKKQVKSKIIENNINKIHTHLTYGRTAEALALCENLLHAEVSKETVPAIKELIKTANEISNLLNGLEKVKTQKALFSSEKEDDRLVKLKRESDYLQIIRQIKQVKPDLEAPEEIRQYDQKQEAFLADLRDHIAQLRRKGNDALLSFDIKSCREISCEIDDVLAIFKPFAESAGQETEKLKNWNREFNRLFTWLENEPQPPDWFSNFHILMEKWINIAGDSRVKQVISAVNDAGLEELHRQREQLGMLTSFREDSPLAFWLHHFLEQQLNVHRIWKVLDENAPGAEILIEKYIESSRRGAYENPLKTVKEVGDFFAALAQLDREPQADAQKLEQALETGRLLHSRLQEIPRLKGKKMHKRLEDHLSRLHQHILKTKEAAIESHSTELEKLLKELVGTEDDYITRLQLEEQAKNEIEKLGKVSPGDAQRFERRLNDLLEQLLEISKRTPQNEHLKPFNELQRRICEEWQNENNVDMNQYLKKWEQDPDFKDVIPDYKRRHQNVLYKLEKLGGELNEEHLQLLLELRKDFGQFPEIESALQETKHEIARQRNREEFEKVMEAFQEARRVKEWQQLREAFANITPSLLDESLQVPYSKMKKEVEYQLAIREPLGWQELEQFLTSGKNQPTETWLKALEWNVREKRGELKPAPETLRNIADSEIHWLGQKHLDFESLLALRRIKRFIREIYHLNTTPTQEHGERR